MTSRNLFAILAVILTSGSARPAEPVALDPDEEVLQFYRVKLDAGVLLDFLRQRTATPEKDARVRELIDLLKQTRFAVREKAARDLIAVGPVAVRQLREAAKNADAEVADRASRCIAEIEVGPGVDLIVAVLHVLKKRNPSQAAAVVLAYLPNAADPYLEGEALRTLAVVGMRDGRALPLIAEKADDGLPIVRAAAGFVLGQSTDIEQRKQALPLLRDPDAWVRLRAAQGLIAGRDPAGVHGLIELLSRPPSELTWPAEDVLRRLAGENSPEPPRDDTEAARVAYCSAWSKWWEANAAKVNLAAVDQETPLIGYTLGVEWNTNRVWECGLDRKQRWQIACEGPMDAHVLPGNRVLIAEANSKRISERDFQGNILWKVVVDQEPINCQRLTNGNTFVGTRTHVLEVKRDGGILTNYPISDQYLHAVRRLPNGHYVGLTAQGLIHEIDARGKSVRKVQVPHEGTWGDVDAMPGGQYLVANYGAGFMRQVDGQGKTVWEIKAPDCCGLERLSGGQYLLGCGTKVMVVDRTGKVLWEATGQGSNRRVHRR